MGFWGINNKCSFLLDRLEVYSNVVEGMGSNTLPTYTGVIMDWSCTKWERISMTKGKLIIGEKYYT